MFYVRNRVNPKLLLTTARANGSGNQWKPESLCGPGGYKVRTFKRKETAETFGIAEETSP